MSVKNTPQKCVLLFVADGFAEAETVALLSSLRRAGVCIKSVGLTAGPVSGVCGVWLVPDLTLTDLDRWDEVLSVGAVVLPDGSESLARLEVDPRVHRLLRRVVAQQGQIVTGCEGLRVVQAAGIPVDGMNETNAGRSCPVVLRRPDQALQVIADDLIFRLKWPSQMGCQESWQDRLGS